MLPSQPNRSVLNALTCLQQVIGHDGPIGSREAARQLGMEESRVRRLLHTLAGIGLLSRDDRARYRPGPGLHVLATQSLRASRLLPLAIPHLNRLRDAGCDIAALAVLWQGQVSYLVHAEHQQRAEDGIVSHDYHPATHSSLGHILLAHAEDRTEQLKALKRSGRADDLTRKGHGADLSRGVPAMLADAKRRGYAHLIYPNGLVSVAVAIGVPPIASIGVARKGMTARDVEAMVTRLTGIANDITERLSAPKDAPANGG
jgi:DNA-binding IclR family transcriptional regulator